MARRSLVLLISVTLLAAIAPASRAQAAELDIDVIAQPIWHTPGDPLDLSLRLTNLRAEPIPGYIVTVTAHGRVLSRSELHQSFDAPTTFEASSITAINDPDDEIAVGGEVVREITDPVGTLQSLTLTGESGVYPLTISVFDASGTVLGTTSTQLLYYPTPPEFRLPTVPVVPIADLPRRGPNGTFEAASDGTFPLETAVAAGGWLRGLVSALDDATAPPPEPPPERRRPGRDGRDRPPPEPGGPEPLHAAVVMMPRLAEELTDIADGYRRADDESSGAEVSATIDRTKALLADIRQITARRSVQSVLAPYSFPDLPTMFELFDDAAATVDAARRVQQELLEAESVLAPTLGKPPSRSWIYTPGGRLNHDSLEELQQLATARFTIFGEQSLEAPEDPNGGGCPELLLSFTCPVTVTTSVGRSTGYVLDSDLQERVGEIARGDGGRAAIQRFFAETAMIREEVPSRTDRVITIGLPGLWEPPLWTTRLLLEGLRDAPWLQTFTPREGLDVLGEQIQPTERRIRFVTPPLVNEPDPDYVEEIARANEIVEGFRGVQPPPALIQRLTRNTLVSGSRLWWRDPGLLLEGERYATEAADEAERELGKITIAGNSEIALTSRRAEIPLVVLNDASYDVSVTVRISSTDLRIDETFRITVQARGLRQLSVDVAAQSSGIFTVFVDVETPDGHPIDDRRIQVRSTEFNEIALGLTFGALAFLVLFYITRAIRGRRGGSAKEPAA